LGDAATARLALAWSALGARVRDALAPLAAAMRGRYQKLEPRERVLVRILGALLAVFLAYNLLYTPIIGAVGGLTNRIQQRQHDAVEVAQMMRAYWQLQADLATMRKRTVPAGGDFSLFSVIEQALTRAPGKDKIGSITPADKQIPGALTQHTVEVRLNALNLGQIVDMLYGLQTMSAPVTVSNLHITRRTQDPHTYDVEMTCVALGRNG
jgi:type II secretory pathway component PulM